ncbi:MAG: hypothetical protein LBK29_03600 [Oscillospiraceae bacterium]|nr:hypothetical protein [Oscillospiraceae bacterium]
MNFKAFSLSNEDFEDNEEDSDDFEEDEENKENDKNDKEDKKEVKDEDLNVAGAFREGAEPVNVLCNSCGSRSVLWVTKNSAPKEFVCPNCGRSIKSFNLNDYA